MPGISPLSINKTTKNAPRLAEGRGAHLILAVTTAKSYFTVAKMAAQVEVELDLGQAGYSRSPVALDTGGFPKLINRATFSALRTAPGVTNSWSAICPTVAT